MGEWVACSRLRVAVVKCKLELVGMFLVCWFRYRNKHDRPASQSALVVQQRDDLTQSIRAEGSWGEGRLMRNTREHEEREREK